MSSTSTCPFSRCHRWCSKCYELFDIHCQTPFQVASCLPLLPVVCKACRFFSTKRVSEFFSWVLFQLTSLVFPNSIPPSIASLNTSLDIHQPTNPCNHIRRQAFSLLKPITHVFQAGSHLKTTALHHGEGGLPPAPHQNYF